MNGSGLSSAYLQTPPPDNRLPDHFQQHFNDEKLPGFEVEAWLEVWDYAGGASFRAFVANDGEEKSLFVFFDFQGVMGRDLKKAYVTLIPPHFLNLFVNMCLQSHGPHRTCRRSSGLLTRCYVYR